MQENKNVIIIGSGIAGLAAGCYLQMNGYHTEIFEMNSTAGGLCTSWKRKGYIFDGCLHWLVGSNPSDPLYRKWSELLDMKKLQFIDPEIFIRVEDGKGNHINVFTDIDKLEQEFLTKAPEDKKLIRQYARAVRKLSNMKMENEKPDELRTFGDGLKMMATALPYLPVMSKWMKVTARELASRCKNPLLSRTFMHMFVPEMASVFLMFTSAWFHKRSAGYPIGGSAAFIREIEKRYLDLGGTIHFKCRVSRILTEDQTKHHAATGVLLENGERRYAHRVVSAADGYTTLFGMLEGKFLNDTIRGYYEKLTPFSSYVQVSLGIKRTFDQEPSYVAFPIDPPLVIDPESSESELEARIFNFDPTMAPDGKTVITCLTGTRNHTYWVDLRNNHKKKYTEEKKRIAEEVTGHLEQRFGKIRDLVEEIDIATPATVIRYTGNWKGSFEGWLLTPEAGWGSLRKMLPGLSNFYMAGHWVVPGGGLPSGLLSGRWITQIICNEDRKKFTTSTV